MYAKWLRIDKPQEAFLQVTAVCMFESKCVVYNVFVLDVGDLYKRLLNHRPVIQNEVHYFLKEFEVS